MVQKNERTARYVEATRLRKRGFTYREIAEVVGVSKSTVSAWFSRETWSVEITKQNAERSARENSKRISLLNKARANQLKKMYTAVARSAETEYTHYKKDPLFIAGLSLYMIRGDMLHTQNIRFTSSHIEAHRILRDFLATYLGVSREKMRFWLLLYPPHDPLQCTRVWSKELAVPISQFGKYHVVTGKSKKEQLRFGVGNTIIGDTVLKHTLREWIKIMQRDLNI